MIILSVVEWIVWSISLLIGLWFSLGIRQMAIQRVAPPMWPTLIISFALVGFPVVFLFLSFSKLHIAWLLVVTWFLSFRAGVVYIPLISQLLIWPAYFYGTILITGTGMCLSSPSKKSPWAARRLSPEEEAHLARIMESRTQMIEPPAAEEKE